MENRKSVVLSRSRYIALANQPVFITQGDLKLKISVALECCDMMKQMMKLPGSKAIIAMMPECPHCHTPVVSAVVKNGNGNGNKDYTKRGSWTIGLTWRMDPQTDGSKKKVWFNKTTGEIYKKAK